MEKQQKDEDDGQLPVKGKEKGPGARLENKQTPWPRSPSLFAFAMSFHLSLYVLAHSQTL
jgi:hypothetical protein